MNLGNHSTYITLANFSFFLINMPINHLHHKSDTECETLIRYRVIDLHIDSQSKNFQIKQLTDVLMPII